MDTEEEVPEIVKEAVKNGLAVPVVLGLLALGAGIGIGYLLGRRTKYEVIKLGDRLPERPPKVVIDADEYPAKELIEDVTIEDDDDSEPIATITVNERIVETNIFAHAEEEDSWDLNAEIEKRNPLAPYVIHRDEFFAEEMEHENYTQSQLTYYAGDDVLVDEDEQPIYNPEMVIGPLRFGHGSGDPNVFYARNMTRAAEYEVIRDPGHYRVEVLGLEMEEAATLKEKKAARQRKFRQE